MAEENIFNLRGLKTFPSEFTEEPGGLLDCKNVVINARGTIEARRGFKLHDSLTGGLAVFAYSRIMEYQERLLLNSYSETDNILAYGNSSHQSFTIIDNDNPHFGTNITPAAVDQNRRMREFKQNGNFYFTTSDGVKKLDIFSGPWYNAGIFRALGGSGALANPTGWFEHDTQVAYRVLWGYTDANDTVVLGPPSGRIEVTQNAGSGETRDIQLTLQVPPDATASHFFQVYRSPQSADSSTPGNEEMGLVYEANPTAAEITAAEVVFTDSTPDTLRGATIYTAPSQEGLINSNFEPPFSKDVTSYKNMGVYANTRRRHNILITLLGVGAPNGIQEDDDITIARAGVDSFSFQLRAITDSGTPASGEFVVEQDFTPAENVSLTAQNIVDAINSDTSNASVYAVYESGFNDLPGKIRIYERNLSDTNGSTTLHGSLTVTVSSNGSTAWSPDLSSAKSSSAEVAVNRIYFSKPNQPESVPLLRFVNVGGRNFDILRCFGLQDGILVLKEDGIFAIYGETFESFVVQKIDSTAVLKSYSSAVVLNERVFCLSTQGIISISMNGVQIVSRDIESDILMLLNQRNLDTTFWLETTWALAYESERKYILFISSFDDEGGLLQASDNAFVYDLFTQQWTKWKTPSLDNGGMFAGIVASFDDKIYLNEHFDSSNSNLLVERKDKANTDYLDSDQTITISSSSATQVNFTTSHRVEPGYVIIQGALSSIVTDNLTTDPLSSTNKVTVEDDLSWDADTATLRRPIDVSVSFLPVFAKSPSMTKAFTDTEFFFRDETPTKITTAFKTETEDTEEEVDNTVSFASGVINMFRVLIPRPKVMANLLYVTVKHVQANTKFVLSGMKVGYEEMSERNID